MQYIRFTYVDSQTRIPVDQAPARNGPAFPPIPDLEFLFALETEYPTTVPTFYGRYEQSVPMPVPGVMENITPHQALADHQAEMLSRLQHQEQAIIQMLSDPDLISQARSRAAQLADQINQATDHQQLKDLQITQGWPQVLPFDPADAT